MQPRRPEPVATKCLLWALWVSALPLLLPPPEGGVTSSRVVESYLWECKQLGAYSPIVLLNTLLFFCTKHFGFTTLAQHQSLSFTNFTRHSKPGKRAAKVDYLRYHRGGTATPHAGGCLFKRPVLRCFKRRMKCSRCPYLVQSISGNACNALWIRFTLLLSITRPKKSPVSRRWPFFLFRAIEKEEGRRSGGPWAAWKCCQPAALSCQTLRVLPLQMVRHTHTHTYRKLNNWWENQTCKATEQTLHLWPLCVLTARSRWRRELTCSSCSQSSLCTPTGQSQSSKVTHWRMCPSFPGLPLHPHTGGFTVLQGARF